MDIYNIKILKVCVGVCLARPGMGRGDDPGGSLGEVRGGRGGVVGHLGVRWGLAKGLPKRNAEGGLLCICKPVAIFHMNNEAHTLQCYYCVLLWVLIK